MKRILVILAVLLVLMSCGTSPQDYERHAKEIIFWDESLPKEQCAGLYIIQGLTITSYNGVPVNWGGNSLLYLPPGSVTFTMDVDYICNSTGDSRRGTLTHYTGENCPFQWTFKPGDYRQLRGWERDGEPVILVVDWFSDTKWDEQPAYKLPLRKSPLILQ